MRSVPFRNVVHSRKLQHVLPRCDYLITHRLSHASSCRQPTEKPATRGKRVLCWRAISPTTLNSQQNGKRNFTASLHTRSIHNVILTSLRPCCSNFATISSDSEDHQPPFGGATNLGHHGFIGRHTMQHSGPALHTNYPEPIQQPVYYHQATVPLIAETPPSPLLMTGHPSNDILNGRFNGATGNYDMVAGMQFSYENGWPFECRLLASSSWDDTPMVSGHYFVSPNEYQNLQESQAANGCLLPGHIHPFYGEVIEDSDLTKGLKVVKTVENLSVVFYRLPLNNEPGISFLPEIRHVASGIAASNSGQAGTRTRHVVGALGVTTDGIYKQTALQDSIEPTGYSKVCEALMSAVTCNTIGSMMVVHVACQLKPLFGSKAHVGPPKILKNAVLATHEEQTDTAYLVFRCDEHSKSTKRPLNSLLTNNLFLKTQGKPSLLFPAIKRQSEVPESAMPREDELFNLFCGCNDLYHNHYDTTTEVTNEPSPVMTLPQAAACTPLREEQLTVVKKGEVRSITSPPNWLLLCFPIMYWE